MATSSIEINNLEVSSSLRDISRYPDAPRPFDYYAINDLLTRYSIGRLRKDVLSCVQLSLKTNDLYNFLQSGDLMSEIPASKLKPSITTFCDLMLNKVRPHLERELKLSLSDEIFDITVSRYDRGNYLLCHNDDIKNSQTQQARTLAFVYYLTTKPWGESDGGALMIYESDASGEPVKIVNKVYPQPNTLIIFKTGPTSWHSVQEVLRNDDTRLSINGWFHQSNSSKATAASQLTAKVVEPCPYDLFKPISLDNRIENFFNDCVNPEYLMPKTYYRVRQKFKKFSEINLPNFLTEDKFQVINEALKEAARTDSNLTLVGPYNKRHYKRFKIETLPQICKDLLNTFRSELFFVLLSRLTGLNFQPPGTVLEDQTNSTDDDGSDDDDGGDEDEEYEEGKNDCDQLGGTDVLDMKHTSDGQGLDTKTEPKAGTDSRSEEGNQGSEIMFKRNPAKKKRDCDPFARLEFRHLEPGAYSLIHDYGFELGERSALDVILHFNHDFEVIYERGGYISYIDVSQEYEDPEELELLSVDPKSNSLSLIYRGDESTCRFLKYITANHQSSFQDLYCVYYQSPDDIPPGVKRLKTAETAERSPPD